MGPPVSHGRRPLRHPYRILLVEQSLIQWQGGQWLATHHFGPWSDEQLDRPDPINQLVLSCPSTCVSFLSNVLFNLYLQNNSQLFYLIRARRWGLKVNYVDSKGVLTAVKLYGIKTKISRGSEFQSWYEYTVSTRANGFLYLAYSQHKLDPMVGGGA